MNKTIIINIGNAIIHIEEEGYEILMAYLNEIKQHFAKTADDFEIVKDIENRIAEMFGEILLRAQKQAIDVDDVKAVIAQMGSVKDFLEEEEEPSSSQYDANFIGVKKLYRDTEGGVIAGVCSGLAHYLNIEKRWLRLAFFLLIFLGGTGFLAYFILWLVIPKAASRSERMEMRGEATNLYGYKKSFEDEVEMLKRNMRSANNEIKPVVTGVGGLLASLFKGIGKLVGAVGSLLGKAFAWFIIVFGFGFLVFFIVMLGLLLGASEEGLYSNFPVNILNVSYKNELIFAAFFTVFIPVLALVLFAVKVIFNHIQITRYFTFLLLGVWIIAAVVTSANVARVLASFNEEAEMVKTIDLKPYKRYTFKVNPEMVFSEDEKVRYKIGEDLKDFKVFTERDRHGVFVDPKNVSLEFERTDEPTVSIMQSFKSNGKNFEDALINSQNLMYQYTVTDSLITLTPKAVLKKAAAWRDQRVVLKVKMPIGTEVLLHRDLYAYLKFYYFYCDRPDDRSNEESEVWVMTKDGLKCKYELDNPKKEEVN
jgi:phage shock protein PspC (stress-responsive transcriptional regulator)